MHTEQNYTLSKTKQLY